MLLVHYQHRLPATFDVAEEKRRYTETASYWEAMPSLYFKAFLLREKGHYGAATNVYSSLYLWQQKAFHAFLAEGTFNYVTDRYGRPQIETPMPVAALRGSSEHANFLYRQSAPVPPDTDIDAAIAQEARQNQASATQPGAVVAVTGLNVQSWQFTRVVISEREPDGTIPGVSYQILHLARPLLKTLPDAL